MQLSAPLRTIFIGVAAVCLCAAQPQPPQAPAPDHKAPESGTINDHQGLAPRTGPADYPVQAKLGAITLAADFAGHGLPTPDGPLSTEDYLVVEVAFFGPTGKRLPVSFNDFSLRINNRKNPTASESYEQVGASVKDPEWTSPEKPDKGGNGILGGGGGANDTSKDPPRPPAELRRAWARRVWKAALADGDRPLPQDGLLFFSYGGKVKGIRSLELIYSGPAGKATLDLQP
jgi:hypothetical protein